MQSRKSVFGWLSLASMEILAAPRDISILEGTVIGSFGLPSITKYNFLKYQTPENHSINFIIQHQNQ